MRRLLAVFAVVFVAPATLLGAAFAGERMGGGDLGAEELAGERAWTARVNELCRAEEAELDRLPQGRTPAELARRVFRAKAIGRRYDRAVLALRVPRRFQADVDRLWRSSPEGYRLLDALVSATRSGDPRRLAAVKARGRRHERAVRPVLKRLGLDACL